MVRPKKLYEIDPMIPSIARSCTNFQLAHVNPLVLIFVLLTWNYGESISTAKPLSVGDIVAVQQDSGDIFAIDPLTGDTRVFNEPLSGLSQAVVDSKGRIVTATRNPRGVIRVDPASGGIEVLAGGPLLQRPSTVAFESETTLLVGDLRNGIIRVDLLSGEQSLLNPLTRVQDIEVAAGGTIFILDAGNFNAGGGRIMTLDSESGEIKVLSEGGLLFNPSDISLSSSGDLIVANRRASTLSEVLRVDTETGQQHVLLTFPSVGFISHEDDSHIVIGDFSRNLILRANINTGTLETVAELGDSGSITGIAVYIPEPQSVFLATWCMAMQSLSRSRRLASI